MYICECLNEDCNKDIPTEEYLYLMARRKNSDYYITLKGHVPANNIIVLETEHLVLRKYK